MLDHPVSRSFQVAVRLFNEDFDTFGFSLGFGSKADLRVCPNDFELQMNIYLKQEDAAPDAHEMAIKSEIVIKGWK